MERVIDDQAAPSSSWLLALMAVPNFFHSCPIHPGATPGNRKLTRFCRLCEKALCKECARDHKACGNLITLVRASRFPAFKITEIKPLIDTAGLETFLINQNNIHFLHGRPRNAIMPNENQCRCCKRVLSTWEALYCSIQCKYRCNGDLAPRPLNPAEGGTERRDDRDHAENRQAQDEIWQDQRDQGRVNAVKRALSKGRVPKVPQRKRVCDDGPEVLNIVVVEEKDPDPTSTSKKRRKGLRAEEGRTKQKYSRREKEETDPWILEQREKDFWTGGRGPHF